MDSYDVIVVGGGPSGMMAAGRAGAEGARVLLLEKNERLGKKLSITGGRRCNITNAEFDNTIFLENFPESKGYLFSPFSRFNVEDTFTFFEGRGLPIMVEDRKRAFPRSEKAEDVCRVLETYVQESGNVDVVLHAEVMAMEVEEGRLVGVRTTRETYRGAKMIVATGGLAAPDTGSTGEGLSMLRVLGHTVKEPDPSLVPLKSPAKWVQKLSGVSVDDAKIRFIQDGKTRHSVTGRILFTHFGLSGPTIINAARTVKELCKNGPVEGSLDLFPDLDHAQLDLHLRARIEAHPKQQLKRAFQELVPKRLGLALMHHIDPNLASRAAQDVSREQRRALGRLLKDARMQITGTMGYKWAIVADGGVEPREIDFTTMQSRLHNNLYLIGDTININRPSGGFSLQLCWTMGWVSGAHVATDL